jgi:replicative DNA helicase
MLSDLRDSGAIEQDADIVLMIYRDEYYNPETEKAGIADLIIAKQRSGPVGSLELVFQSNITKFKNPARM